MRKCIWWVREMLNKKEQVKRDLRKGVVVVIVLTLGSHGVAN